MRTRRFYCASLALGPAQLDKEEAKHALSSVRLEPGALLQLFDGRGNLAEARLVQPSEGCSGGKSQPTQVEITRVWHEPPRQRRLTLIASGCKGERLDWMVEKCTELGVWSLRIASFARTVVKPGDTRLDRLKRIVREACKQCGRNWLLEIETGVSLPDAIAGWREGTHAQHLLIADPEPAAATLAGWLRSNSSAARDVAIVVGPEGGLTPEELGLLHAAGGQAVRLAETILRTETAAIACAASWAAALMN